MILINTTALYQMMKGFFINCFKADIGFKRRGVSYMPCAIKVAMTAIRANRFSRAYAIRPYIKSHSKS